MIKFLFDNFSGMPVVGTPIKAAYVGSLVKDVIQQGKNSPVKDELKTMAGNELENALNNQANAMFDQHIGPVISQHNIPTAITDPIKQRAISEMVAVMKQKVMQVKK